MVIKIGLTGGIGSGKSTVGRLLEVLGVPVLDADAVVHTLLAQNPAVRQWLLERYGCSLLDEQNQIDRQALGQKVFANEAERKALEGLLHPLVREQTAAFFKQHQAKPQAGAMVPLIFETQTQSAYDVIWLVSLPETLQRERLKESRGLSEEQITQRLAAQMPLAQKQALLRPGVDALIDNSGSLEETQRQVLKLLQP